MSWLFGASRSTTAADEPAPSWVADPFKNDDHRGNPNLAEWPPSNTERRLATQVLLGVPGASGALLVLCGTPVRAAAVTHLIRVEHAAAELVDRVRTS